MNRYYINIKNGNSEITLLQLEDSISKLVTFVPLQKELNMPALHDTLHSKDPGKGLSQDVVHVREHIKPNGETQTLLRSKLSSEYAQGELIHQSCINISGINWAKAKQFSKTSFKDKAVIEFEKFNAYLTIYLYRAKGDDFRKVISKSIRDGKLHAFIPMRGRIKTAPPGHTCHYVLGDFRRENKKERIIWVVLGTNMPDERAWDNLPENVVDIGYAAFGDGKREIRLPKNYETPGV